MSKNRPFTALNPKSVKIDYPKTYKDITEWLTKSATEGNILTEEMIQAFIYGNPRFLYDYFDDRDILINITYTGELFVYWNNIDRNSRTAGTRKAAEEAAFETALEIQESRL